MKLWVCLDSRLAGALETSRSLLRLTYTAQWLNDPDAYPLSQSLPLQPGPLSGASVTHYLWGLLPDNVRILETWARRFHVSARNPMALLAHVGEDCAGAVQFVREDRLDAVLRNDATTRVEWLDDGDLELRIQHLAADAGAARESMAEGQFSLSGAQAKTALYFDRRRRRWGIPQGRTPTTHILKPASNDFDGFAENEHFCLTLARRVGIAAAVTAWQSIGGVPTLIVERYDRIPHQGQWRRIHQEDCCQALGVPPGSKYESDGGPGFARIMSLLSSTDKPHEDRARLMAAACFIYLLAATDAHAKNFSVLYGRGASRPAMRLAPLYDLASAWYYSHAIQPQKMKLAMQVGRHYRLREIQPRHFEALAKACQYPPEAVIATLEDLCRKAPDEGSLLIREFDSGGMKRHVLATLLDGLAAQCKATLRQMHLGCSAP